MTGARRTGLMGGICVSDFVLSILVAIGIMVIALGVVAWMSLRRNREETRRQ